jgi:hypothetical protein
VQYRAILHNASGRLTPLTHEQIDAIPDKFLMEQLTMMSTLVNGMENAGRAARSRSIIWALPSMYPAMRAGSLLRSPEVMNTFARTMGATGGAIMNRTARGLVEGVVAGETVSQLRAMTGRSRIPQSEILLGWGVMGIPFEFLGPYIRSLRFSEDTWRPLVAKSAEGLPPLIAEEMTNLGLRDLKRHYTWYGRQGMKQVADDVNELINIERAKVAAKDAPPPAPTERAASVVDEDVLAPIEGAAIREMAPAPAEPRPAPVPDEVDDLVSTISQQELTEGPLVDGRVVPRLRTGGAPRKLYRYMSREEYEGGMRRGSFSQRDGGSLNASAMPDGRYKAQGTVLVEIDYFDADGWYAKYGGDELYAATHTPIPASRVRLVSDEVGDLVATVVPETSGALGVTVGGLPFPRKARFTVRFNIADRIRSFTQAKFPQGLDRAIRVAYEKIRLDRDGVKESVADVLRAIKEELPTIESVTQRARTAKETLSEIRDAWRDKWDRVYAARLREAQNEHRALVERVSGLGLSPRESSRVLRWLENHPSLDGLYEDFHTLRALVETPPAAVPFMQDIARLKAESDRLARQIGQNKNKPQMSERLEALRTKKVEVDEALNGAIADAGFRDLTEAQRALREWSVAKERAREAATLRARKFRAADKAGAGNHVPEAAKAELLSGEFIKAQSRWAKERAIGEFTFRRMTKEIDDAVEQATKGDLAQYAEKIESAGYYNAVVRNRVVARTNRTIREAQDNAPWAAAKADIDALRSQPRGPTLRQIIRGDVVAEPDVVQAAHRVRGVLARRTREFKATIARASGFGDNPGAVNAREYMSWLLGRLENDAVTSISDLTIAEADAVAKALQAATAGARNEMKKLRHIGREALLLNGTLDEYLDAAGAESLESISNAAINAARKAWKTADPTVAQPLKEAYEALVRQRADFDAAMRLHTAHEGLLFDDFTVEELIKHYEDVDVSLINGFRSENPEVRITLLNEAVNSNDNRLLTSLWRMFGDGFEPGVVDRLAAGMTDAEKARRLFALGLAASRRRGRMGLHGLSENFFGPEALLNRLFGDVPVRLFEAIDAIRSTRRVVGDILSLSTGPGASLGRAGLDYLERSKALRKKYKIKPSRDFDDGVARAVGRRIHRDSLSAVPEVHPLYIEAQAGIKRIDALNDAFAKTYGIDVAELDGLAEPWRTFFREAREYEISIGRKLGDIGEGYIPLSTLRRPKESIGTWYREWSEIKDRRATHLDPRRSIGADIDNLEFNIERLAENYLREVALNPYLKDFRQQASRIIRMADLMMTKEQAGVVRNLLSYIHDAHILRNPPDVSVWRGINKLLRPLVRQTSRIDMLGLVNIKTIFTNSTEFVTSVLPEVGTWRFRDKTRNLFSRQNARAILDEHGVLGQENSMGFGIHHLSSLHSGDVNLFDTMRLRFALERQWDRAAQVLYKPYGAPDLALTRVPAMQAAQRRTARAFRVAQEATSDIDRGWGIFAKESLIGQFAGSVGGATRNHLQSLFNEAWRGNPAALKRLGDHYGVAVVTRALVDYGPGGRGMAFKVPFVKGNWPYASWMLGRAAVIGDMLDAARMRSLKFTAGEIEALTPEVAAKIMRSRPVMEAYRKIVKYIVYDGVGGMIGAWTHTPMLGGTYAALGASLVQATSIYAGVSGTGVDFTSGGRTTMGVIESPTLRMIGRVMLSMVYAADAARLSSPWAFKTEEMVKGGMDLVLAKLAGDKPIDLSVMDFSTPLDRARLEKKLKNRAKLAMEAMVRAGGEMQEGVWRVPFLYGIIGDLLHNIPMIYAHEMRDTKNDVVAANLRFLLRFVMRGTKGIAGTTKRTRTLPIPKMEALGQAFGEGYRRKIVQRVPESVMVRTLSDPGVTAVDDVWIDAFYATMDRYAKDGK